MKCHACDLEIKGTSRREVLDLGWKFYTLPNGDEQIWCDECEAALEEHAEKWRRLDEEDDRQFQVAMENFDQELEKLLGDET